LMIIMLQGVSMRYNLAAWMQICKRLGLRDQVLYAETGTSIFPWLRGKPFPFFRQYIQNPPDNNTTP
jgi:hypothetical protein